MMALTKDVMGFTTGYDGTHYRVWWHSQQDVMAHTKDVMGLTTGYNGTHKGCNGAHNRI
jgi:hypothetical protein